MIAKPIIVSVLFWPFAYAHALCCWDTLLVSVQKLDCFSSFVLDLLVMWCETAVLSVMSARYITTVISIKDSFTNIVMCAWLRLPHTECCTHTHTHSVSTTPESCWFVLIVTIRVQILRQMWSIVRVMIIDNALCNEAHIGNETEVRNSGDDYAMTVDYTDIVHNQYSLFY